jgi:exosortase/archaeosortase family protein
MTVKTLARRSPRWVAGLAAAAAGGYLISNTAAYRDGEAWSAAQVVAGLIGKTYHVAGSSTFFVGLGGPHAIGLNITPACSTAAIAGALLIITGLLISLADVQPLRAALGTVAAVGVVALVNLLRLVVLSWSATRWGVAGWFEWLHVYGGSLLTILAVIAACLVYLRCIRRGPTRTAARHGSS